MRDDHDAAVDQAAPPAVELDYPYVGPLTFTRNEADRFFGREREARDLLALVARERLVLFFAQSGAGKSSLLNARLIPNLPAQGFDVLPVARVSGDIPEGVDPAQVPNIFVYNLILSLDRGLPEAERWTPAELAGYGLLRYLAGDEVAAHSETPQEAGTTPPPDAAPDLAPTVLVIDQFEEIFTTHIDRWNERPAFFAQLRTALEWLPNLWVVLTMREDYVPPLEPYAELLPNRLRARFYMQRMEEAAALEAVERPAARYGRPFDAGVAQTLVNNLRRIRVQYRDEPPLDKYVEPVQLQVVCLELWKKLQDRPLGPITEADLPLDYIDQALTRFYESALFDTLADPKVQAAGVSEQALRDWFSHELITETGIRNTIPRNEKTQLTGTLPGAAVDVLKRHFLIRTEPRAGGEWVELVHDRFIGPIQESNQAWRDALLQEDPLLRAADQWDKSGRTNTDLLLTGTALQQALIQAATAPRGSLIHDFLDASQGAQRALDLANAQRREEEARQQAAEATRQAEREKRTARALRWQRIALAVLAGLVLVFLLIALQQRGDALDKAADLDKAVAELQVKAADLDEALGEIRTINQDLEQAKTAAEENARRADSKAREADAARLTAVSLSLANQSRNSSTSESALLFGQAAAAISPTLEAQTALLSALDTAYRNDFGEVVPFYPSRSLTTTGEIPLQRLAFSRDGSLLALGDRSGDLQFWDTRTQRPFGQPVPAHAQGGITGLAFDPTRPRLVTAGGSQDDPMGQRSDILLWELQQGTPVSRTLATDVSPVSTLAFSPDGRTLAVNEIGGRLTLWTLDERVPLSRTLATDPGSSGALAFDPNGRLAVAGNGQVTLWYDLTTSQPMSQTLSEPGSQPVVDVQFSPDGTWLAAAVTDGMILRWNLDADPQPPQIVAERAGIPPRRLAFADDGRLAVGWQDASISLIDPGAGASTPQTLLTRPGTVTDLAFDPAQPDLLVAVIDNHTLPQAWDLDQRREFATVQRLVSPIQVPSEKPTQESPVSVALDTASLRSISPDGQQIGVIDATGSPFVVNLAEPSRAIPIPTESAKKYTALAFSPDGRLLAIAGCEPARPGTADKPGTDVAQTTTEINPASQVPLRLLTGPEQMSLPTATPAPDEEVCASGSVTVDVWDLSSSSPQRKQVLSTDSGELRSLVFHPQEDVLVAGSTDGTILRWRLENGSPDYLPLEQVPQLTDLAFDQNGTRLAALGETGLVRVWNWANGARLASQPGGASGEQYSHLAFVNEDAWLATVVCSTPAAEKAACGAGEVTLWDARTMERLSPRLVLNQPAHDLVYDANRQTLLSLLPNQTVSWQLGRSTWPDLACTRAGRNLTHGEWTTAFPGQNETDYARSRTCPEFPLDVTFVTAKRTAAADAVRDCTATGRAQGMALLREAAGMPVQTPVTLVPSDEVIRILSEQALNNLRTEPFEFVTQARACLEQAHAQRLADGQTGFDVTRAIDAAQRLVLAERSLRATLDSESLGLVLDDLQTSMDQRAQWPGDLQTPLAAAYYTLCDRGLAAEACTRFGELAQTLAYGTTLAGSITGAETRDYYFEGRQGDVVNVALTADSGAFDTLIRLEGPGDIAVENDDNPSGGTLDSLIANYVLPEDGVYRIIPRAFSGEGRYRLSLQRQPVPRIAVGETQPGFANNGGVWSFEGQADSVVGIAMNTNDPNLDPYVQLLGPEMQPLGEDNDSGGKRNALLITQLPASGTYLVRTGSTGSTGPYTLSLLEAQPLLPDVTQVVTTTQAAVWVFTGRQGQVVDVTMDGADGASGTIELALSELGGAVLAAGSDTGDVLNARLDPVVLPKDGQYLVSTRALDRPIPFSVTLREVTPGRLSQGEVVTGTTAVNPLWVFDGRAGDVVDLSLERSGAGYDPYVWVTAAGDSWKVTDDDSGGDLNARLAGLILPVDGVYYVRAGRPENTVPYTLTLTAATPTSLTWGVPVTSTTRADTLWAFEGKAGQVISADLSDRSLDFDPGLRLIDGVGRELAVDDNNAGYTNARIHAYVLPQDGRYYLQVSPPGSLNTYELTLSAIEPQLLLPNQPVTATTAAAPAWRLAAAADQVFSIAMTATVPGFDPYLQVYDSQGRLLAEDNDSGGYPNARIDPFAAPASGEYIVLAGRDVSNAPYTLLLGQRTPAPLVIGRSVISTTAQQDLWSFQGRAGQIVDISLDTTSNEFDPYLTLFGPDGSRLQADDDAGGDLNALIRSYVLPQNGQYLVQAGPIVSPVPYTLRVSLTPGVELPAGSDIQIPRDSVWTFRGNAGQLVSLVADDASSLALLDPQGVLLADQTARITTRLAAAGTYTVAVNVVEAMAGHTLRLDALDTPINALVAEVPATSQMAAGATDYWTFDVSAPAGVVISAAAGFGMDMTLFAPGGAPVATSTGQNRLIGPLARPGSYLLAVQAAQPASSGAYTLTLQFTELPPVP